MTSQEPENPQFIEADIPDTEVISVAPPAPVFVDTTGRRSRLLRRLAYGFGALVMLYGGLISVSLVGGPVPSSVVLPLPGLEPADNTGDKKPPQPSPTPATPPSHPATPVFVAADGPAHRTSPPRLESAKVTSSAAAARPVTKPAATKKPTATAGTPKTTPTTTRPVESTTVPTAPATTPPATTPPPVTVPPSPPSVPSGGQGGGGSESPIAEASPTVPTVPAVPSSAASSGAQA